MTVGVTHYPDYNVLDRIDEWDAYTKEVVRKRLGPFSGLRFFSEREARYIAVIASHLIYDDREDILSWVIHHFDDKMSTETGEAQRKVGVPPEQVLVRDGLRVLDKVSKMNYGKDSGKLETDRQFKLLSNLQLGQAPQVSEWSYIPQKELFDKLASVIVSAYYSHPTVWSEIGYGGPMYPGTYLRIEQGLTDGWEATRDGK